MGRVGAVLASLAVVAVFPAVAGAQSYPTGRLVDPALINPPEHVPPGPVGEYPEDWAKCVAETNPAWPTAPPGIDPKGRGSRRSPTRCSGSASSSTAWSPRTCSG